MDKQEGRTMVRTARCHLSGQVQSKPQTSCAPKSLGSRGKKIKLSGDVRRSYFSLMILPWIPLAVTFGINMYF